MALTANDITGRETYTLRLATLADGSVWADLYAKGGEFDGLCVISAEGDTRLAALVDLAQRMCRD